MQTWIFQGNPDRFDIDGYLASDPPTINWLVSQSRDRIAVGDTVYLWRAKGSANAVSGVIAECRVASPVAIRLPDDASAPFWQGDEIPEASHRVDLTIVRVARPKEVLRREWLLGDPVLRDLPNFRFAQGTNFPVEGDLATRLNLLWKRTGVDWSWRDSVAGLWVYVETQGDEISKLPGSPVANAALAIGRAVTGVYNKVMNFRSIDSTDARAGLDGASDIDRDVWKQFFDASSSKIDRVRLETEVQRLALNLTGEVKAPASTETLSSRASSTSLSALLKRYAAALSGGAFSARPAIAETTANTFVRNPLVVEIARLRAHGACEIPGCAVLTFETASGHDYCEVHHVTPLSEGGDDVIENAICLCPVHHREAHHGKRRAALRTVMQRVRGSSTE